MTKTITTAKINELLKNGQKMSRSELRSHILKNDKFFYDSKILQTILLKNNNPDIDEKELDYIAFNATFDLMVSLGYTYCVAHHGWVLKSMLKVIPDAD